jgi:membrane fusion protein (multidrug efflux system)
MMTFIIFASLGAVIFALLAFLLLLGLRWYVVGAVFAVLSLFFVLADIKAFQIHKMTSGGGGGTPPTTVTSAEVKQENWPPLLSAVGSVSAVQGATISSELPGTVAEVGFESGAVVKKGDLLVRFDTSVEEAQLRSADADTQLAKADLDRARDLAVRKVISKAELDAAESKFKQKSAMTENMRAIIAKKTMLAPFDGIAGIRVVNVGQMVKAGDQIVPLQSLDPVYVDFALPQQRLAELSTGLEVNMRTDAFPGRVFRGTLTAINSAVDVATRNVSLQGTLPNSDHMLKPGMFAKVDVVLPRKEPVLAIPATAIAYAPYGDSVFVIEKKKDEKSGKESQVIRQQFIRTGETRGDFVTVTQGLKAGETVVSSGVFKLRNGMPVVINNELAPKPELSPTPAQT